MRQFEVVLSGYHLFAFVEEFDLMVKTPEIRRFEAVSFREESIFGEKNHATQRLALNRRSSDRCGRSKCTKVGGRLDLIFYDDEIVLNNRTSSKKTENGRGDFVVFIRTNIDD